MSKILPTGSSIYIATGYGSSKAISAFSNAAEGVMTLEASHGIIVGDVMEITSGWGRASGRIARAKTVATNDVTAEGINTASTTLFAAGSGTGSVREITGWQEITQLKELNSSPGQQEYTDVSDFKDTVRKRVPTVRGASETNIVVYDDPSLAFYAYVIAAHEGQTPVACKIVLPSGAPIYGNAYWTLDKMPKFQGRDALTAILTLSFDSELTRYTS